jgi:hypothetical protein
MEVKKEEEKEKQGSKEREREVKNGEEIGRDGESIE